VIGHTNSSAIPFASFLARLLSLSFSSNATSSSRLRVFTSSRSFAVAVCFLLMAASVAARVGQRFSGSPRFSAGVSVPPSKFYIVAA